MQIRIMGIDHALISSVALGTHDGAAGRYVSGRCRFILDPLLAPQEQGATIIHEMLEAIAYKLQLRDNPYNHDRLHAQAEALYAALRDNSGLVKTILAGRRVI